MDEAIDRVMQEAGARFGFGRAPAWVRLRVAAMIEAYAANCQIAPKDAAEQIAEDAAAMEEVLAALRVGETRFFREADQTAAIVRHVAKHVPKTTPIHVLSAGCSTGEEAYTIAMLLAEEGRRFHVLGVDRSLDAVVTAREGRFGIEATRDVPAALLERYFHRERDGIVARSPMRQMVSFEVKDLVEEVPPGPFHAIVFRNVLIYMAEHTGNRVASRLATRLDERGLLFCAASEVTRLSQALDAVRVAGGFSAFRPRMHP